MDTCKGCQTTVHVEEKDIQRLLQILVSSGKELVEDEVYLKRVNACYQCSSLQYGSTCLHCGCIIAVRAKLLERDCPNPSGTKW